MECKDFSFLELIAKGFHVKQMAAVVELNPYGELSENTVGVFREEQDALAYVRSQPYSHFFGTTKKDILTNGKVGYIVKGFPVNLLDNETTASEE